MSPEIRVGAMRRTIIYFRPAKKKYYVEMREKDRKLPIRTLAHSLIGANDTYFDYII